MTLAIHSDEGHLYQMTDEGFPAMRKLIASNLLDTEPLNRGSWQRLDVSRSSQHDTYELRHVTLWMDVSQVHPVKMFQPDLPWAQDHFLERVGGVPVNPGNTHEYWPYHAGRSELHLKRGRYDHNYMERMWPKEAGWDCSYSVIPHFGIRFPYGDLRSVINLLSKESATRQAFLPIWFPEDTGVEQDQRVPCTLGYHFLLNPRGRLDCTYYLRSCEIYRHFTNDLYLAAMLLRWVAEQSRIPGVGQLTVHIASLHGFVGDQEKIEELAE